MLPSEILQLLRILLLYLYNVEFDVNPPPDLLYIPPSSGKWPIFERRFYHFSKLLYNRQFLHGRFKYPPSPLWLAAKKK